MEFVVFQLVDGLLVEPMDVFNRFGGNDVPSARLAAENAVMLAAEKNPGNEYTILPVFSQE